MGKNKKNSENTPQASPGAEKKADRALNIPPIVIRITSVVTSIATLVTGIAAVLIAYGQLQIAATAEERAQRERAFSYVMDAVYEMDNGRSRYVYALQDGREIPVPMAQITVLTGDFKRMSAILYDGTVFQNISNFSSDPKKRGLLDQHMAVVVINQVLEPAPVWGDILYDYFFLYVEPVNGEPFLDLICNEINLNTGSLEDQVYYHRVDLLELDTLEDSPKRTMLSAYAKLYDSLQRLPSPAN